MRDTDTKKSPTVFLLEVQLPGAHENRTTSVHATFEGAERVLRNQYPGIEVQSDMMDISAEPPMHSVTFDSAEWGDGFATIDEFQVCP